MTRNKCKICLIEKNKKEFYKNHIKCKLCYIISIKCEHGKIKATCKDCGGSAICIHGKRKERCKECIGSGICIHGKQKARCKNCHGSQICSHGKQKAQCKECGGSQICSHGKRKERCKNCSPNSNNFCHGCRLYQVNKKTNYLCSYCSPITNKRLKTKEMKVKKFLEKYYNITYNKNCRLNDTCNIYYPDFLIECNSYFIVIECDEYAHNSYDYSCERIRENNITYNLGLPCVFIRYNPDKKGVPSKTKEIILKSTIDYYKNLNPSDIFNFTDYLFY